MNKNIKTIIVPEEILNALCLNCEVELEMKSMNSANGIRTRVIDEILPPVLDERGEVVVKSTIMKHLELEIPADNEWRHFSCFPSSSMSFMKHGLGTSIDGINMVVGSISEFTVNKRPKAIKGAVTMSLRSDGNIVEMNAIHSSGWRTAKPGGFFLEPAGYVELESGIVDLRERPRSKKRGLLIAPLECEHSTKLPDDVATRIESIVDDRDLLKGGHRPGRKEALSIAAIADGMGETKLELHSSMKL